MKLSQWAKKQGISYQTAWNLFKKKMIPKAYQLPTGTIIIPDEEVKSEHVVCYARVSQDKENLETQADRLVSYCNAKGYMVRQVVKECASGLDDKRPEFAKLLNDSRITKIVAEHQDRLTRFGFNYLKILLKNQSCEIEITNGTSDDREDLMRDFVSVVTSFCSRLYGPERCERKTEKIIRELSENDTRDNNAEKIIRELRENDTRDNNTEKIIREPSENDTRDNNVNYANTGKPEQIY
ncbi:IS607 family transposase [Desulfobacterales bacterium HSG2]|nr:IS607 family transposase [Desulfobacterales bacterium HSG2]